MSNLHDESKTANQAFMSMNVGSSSQRIELDSTEHPLSILWDDESEVKASTSAMKEFTLPLASSMPLDSNHDISTEAATPTAPTTVERPDTQRMQDASAEARSVRRNMFLAAWNGFTVLAKGRKWILMLRLLIGLAQLVVGIVILSLSSSMGISGNPLNTCNPQGMFVFLTLHVIRVAFSIPVDFYLGLSPHRTPSSRRIGAEGQSDRERSRMFGSLALDRKLSRISDLLGLCHVILFIVGNYTVWTSLECSHSSAQSRPLWIACVCMLSVTYTIIIEVMLMILLLVFFLPLLIAILRALGLATNLPQRGIRPETGKVDQNVIEEQTRLVYFTLEKADEEEQARSSREDLERLANPSPEEADAEQIREALQIPLPLSRSSSIQSKVPSELTLESHTPSAPRRRKRRLGVLFGFASRRSRQDGDVEKHDRIAGVKECAKQDGKYAKGKSKEKPKYPIYPIPAHRATCPICLCDFEELTAGTSSNTSHAEGDRVDDNQQDDDQVEPLRLLKCGHVMHSTCVDQWLTTVSGRCPVCQKPLISTGVVMNTTESEDRPAA